MSRGKRRGKTRCAAVGPLPAGEFSDTLTTLDCNPQENGATDEKVYIRGIGLAIDEDAELVSF